MKIVLFITLSCIAPVLQAQDASVCFHFLHAANDKKIVKDAVYFTPSGESYTLSKLKYYLSTISLSGTSQPFESSSYQLIDAFQQDSFCIAVQSGTYTSVQWLLGIDSLHNCSGAQDGVLDPLNDMFWTWNSGYVFFKLEGTSPSSTADRHRMEHHLGGYKNGQQIAKNICLPLPDSLILLPNQKKHLFITVNLDKYWGNNKLSNNAVCTSPGEQAKQLAKAISELFKIEKVED